MKSKIFFWLLLPCLLLSVYFNIHAFLEPDKPLYIKERLLQIDELIFDGFFRLLKHPDAVPKNIEFLPKPPPNAYEWLKDSNFLRIAHALGPILFAGTNSIDTLKKGYELGFRIFEVDLVLTTDKKLICFHGDSDEQISNLDYQSYLTIARNSNIKPCQFTDLVEITKTYPDIYFILDVKNQFSESYQKIREEIKDPLLGKKFIPQIYHFNQLEDFRKRPFFAGEILTSYKSGLSTEKIFQAAEQTGIQVVTLTLPRAEILNKVPPKIRIFTHPVDDLSLASHLKKKGISGIYTFYLSPLLTPRF